MKRLFPFLMILLLICGCLWAQEHIDTRKLALRSLVERADSGDAKALYDLAYLHDTGFDSIEIDSVRSTALYILSAEKGYAPARNFIGFRYYKGEYVNKDLDSALYWIRLAAEEGDITAAANLGYLLLDSEEIPHDSVAALDWLAVAADAGVTPTQIRMVELAEALKTPKALALLGDAYSKGMGVVYDHHKSVEYFHEAAIAGNPSAQYVVAELLDFFPDTFEGESADYWYEKAAEAGVTDSETAFRTLYGVNIIK